MVAAQLQNSPPSGPQGLPAVSKSPGQTQLEIRAPVAKGASPMRYGSRVVTVLLGLGCLLGLSMSAFAQSATGSLRGTITDSKDLVVSGATATLSNAATGFSRTSMTNDQGIYQFLEVPPAAYVLTVTAAGFATAKRENVVLQ